MFESTITMIERIPIIKIRRKPNQSKEISLYIFVKYKSLDVI